MDRWSRIDWLERLTLLGSGVLVVGICLGITKLAGFW